MNYERLWGKLFTELEGMAGGGMRNVAPGIIITFMTYLEEIEKLTAQAAAREKLLREASDETAKIK